jgi:endonuclease/exonuclease/phosphatase family metal-dependent hydrolase
MKILFWNIWTENQTNNYSRLDELKAELENIINKHQPNIIGLNEVVRFGNKASDVEKLVESLGYKNIHYCKIGPIGTNSTTGSIVASKIHNLKIQELIIGDNITAKNNGYGDHKTKVIKASFKINAHDRIDLFVVHPINLKPSTALEHFRQIKQLKELVSESQDSLSIVGGDFNEPRVYPLSFTILTNKFLKFKTGSILKPTWIYNAAKLSPLRFNLDKIFWTKSPRIEMSKFEVIDSKVSDHRPLIATFEIK